MSKMLVVTKTAYDYGDNTTTVLKCFNNDEIGKEKAQAFVINQKENDLYEYSMHKKIEDFGINFKKTHEISQFGSLSALHNPKNIEDKQRKEAFTKLCRKYTQDFTVAMKEFKQSLGIDEDKHFSSLEVQYYHYEIEEVEIG